MHGSDDFSLCVRVLFFVAVCPGGESFFEFLFEICVGFCFLKGLDWFGGCVEDVELAGLALVVWAVLEAGGEFAGHLFDVFGVVGLDLDVVFHGSSIFSVSCSASWILPRFSSLVIWWASGFSRGL